MNELSSNKRLKSATVVTHRAHDLLLDYINESTHGLLKMSINRIHRAKIEKDECDALQAFENVASEQHKIYVKTFCKPALKTYQKKKKTFDLVAAHISYDITPKIMPQYDFNLPLDENSLSSEQIHENRENIYKLSKDFRLQAAELYLKIVKEESDFQNDKLEKLLNDFPQDKDERKEEKNNDNEPKSPPSTQNRVNDGCGVDVGGNDDEDEVFTQRSLLQEQRKRKRNRMDSELFTRYIEISLKKNFIRN